MQGFRDGGLGVGGLDEAAAPPQKEEFKVFVGGISWQMNDQELKEEFRQFGAISATVMVDKRTNRSRGFGFVYFADAKGMEDSIAKMHHTELRGREISVTRAVPQTHTAPGTPAAALGGGRPGSERFEPRHERRHDRGFDRPDRGHSAPVYNDRISYDRGAPSGRAYPAADFQRTLLDRGYLQPAAYGATGFGDLYARLGYDRPVLDLGGRGLVAPDVYPAAYPVYVRDAHNPRGGGPDRSRTGFASHRPAAGPYDRSSFGRPAR